MQQGERCFTERGKARAQRCHDRDPEACRIVVLFIECQPGDVARSLAGPGREERGFAKACGGTHQSQQRFRSLIKRAEQVRTGNGMNGQTWNAKFGGKQSRRSLVCVRLRMKRQRSRHIWGQRWLMGRPLDSTCELPGSIPQACEREPGGGSQIAAEKLTLPTTVRIPIPATTSIA